MDEREFLCLNEEARGVWDQNAAYWDECMGDQGNAFHRMLVAPAQERLLALRPGERVLEVACGNGQFARRMASLGARVVACDFSQEMVHRAKMRTREEADRIEYRVVDATSREQLLALVPRTFDAAVCGMAIMDMAAIEPLVSSLGVLLKSGHPFCSLL